MLRHCSDRAHQSVAAAAPGTSTTTMASTTFSLFFPLPANKGQWPAAADEVAAAFDDDHSSITTSPSSPSSSSSAGSVDCTLSLGTPSSRRAAAEPAELMTAKRAAARPAYTSVPASAVSWDVAAAAADQSYYCCQGGKPAGAATGAVARAEHDAMLVDRRCANCGTLSTPLWRNGPRGPKSLCNACGIRFKKEERRAAAMDQGQSACGGYVAQRAPQYGPAGKHAPAGVVPAYYGEGAFPCGGGDVADAEAGPFVAWRLNVVAPATPAPAFAVWPERTSLFQYN
ncbi:unnamed protein product [Urochloa decumbens]|uniref:GATA-type domain-containing protein n=1 Tax=Urochloa decumbens TaxID=240449 RepID=A0ABC8W2H1_9POAL